MKNILLVVRFLYQAFPCLVWLYVWDGNRKIEEKESLFKAMQENNEEYVKKHEKEKNNFIAKANLSLSEIEKCHTKEIERKKIIEEKAKANLLAITVSISLMLGVVGLILKDKANITIDKDWLTKIIFVFSIGVLYFLWGGLAALSSIRTDKFGEVYIDDKVRNKGDEAKEKEELVKCIELNTLVTMKRSNYIDSSYVGIRNGIICLGVCFALLVVLLLRIFSK
ncbi:MAG: hypothetical protein NC938_06420 [Candidatus Omnitrophica bacterium]|nr:hypothetical protein [Candidatus Omnitrophota bacterium]MCM8791312.1 hypothetical protein [Candidatus Omnitrophota bacterium]